MVRVQRFASGQRWVSEQGPADSCVGVDFRVLNWSPKESFEKGSRVPKKVSPGLENEVSLNKEGGSVGGTARASQGSWRDADGTEVADLRAIVEGPRLERQPQVCTHR